jgi:hypothetical protein
MGTELLELEPVPPLLELEPPEEELLPPCPSLEDETAELLLIALPLFELEPPAPTKLSGEGGISIFEVHEKINAVASTRAAVSVEAKTLLPLLVMAFIALLLLLTINIGQK